MRVIQPRRLVVNANNLLAEARARCTNQVIKNVIGERNLSVDR